MSAGEHYPAEEFYTSDWTFTAKTSPSQSSPRQHPLQRTPGGLARHLT